MSSVSITVVRDSTLQMLGPGPDIVKVLLGSETHQPYRFDDVHVVDIMLCGLLVGALVSEVGEGNTYAGFEKYYI